MPCGTCIGGHLELLNGGEKSGFRGYRPARVAKRPETVRNRSGIKFYESAMLKLSPQLRSVPKIQQFEDFDENPCWGADLPL